MKEETKAFILLIVVMFGISTLITSLALLIIPTHYTGGVWVLTKEWVLESLLIASIISGIAVTNDVKD